MWNGGYHELHNEPEKDEILIILIDWLVKHNIPVLT
jgi:alpha-beta hydrolase superfamily lysophospholipase